MDLQIDDFYKDVASAMLALYQAFPRKIAVYIDDLIEPEPADEFGLPSKRHQSCLGALLWLADEGYLRYETTVRFEAIEQAVLSEKAFLRLAAGTVPPATLADELTPSLRRSHGSLARQLKVALADVHTEALASLVQQFLRGTAVA